MSKAAAGNISFHFLSGSFSFSQRNKLKEFLVKQLKKEGKQVEAINYIFCNDQYLLEMNQQYLKHNTYTDIITFELSPKGQALLSDIYISIERVKENAVSFKTSFKRELHRVIFHGTLHLAGFKDKTAKEKMLMRSKEEEYLTKYFVPRETKLVKY
jgi:probable rRNA maturation factor